MSTSHFLHSTAEACFNLLVSLNKTNASSNSTTVKLSAVLTVLQQRNTPFYTFMTNQCELSLISLCKQFVPRNAEGKENTIDISVRELEVMFRILCSAASNAEKNNIHQSGNLVQDHVCELLHVTFSMAVADVALELARGVRSMTANFHQQNHTSPIMVRRNNQHQNASMSMMMNLSSTSSAGDSLSPQHHEQQNNTSLLSTTFDVDLEFVQRVTNHIEVFGSSATAKKIIKVLEQVKSSSDEDHDHQLGSNNKNNNNTTQLGKEAINLWNYALDRRTAFGGMNDETRQDLIGAALEVTGRELYPSISSTHVAAELVFRKIVDCIYQ